ncbi:MAG: peptidylprolyl isomerase [Mariniblastus sp.]|nr:peptidylprolyl isomerase [Mariniblastus sp.]
MAQHAKTKTLSYTFARTVFVAIIAVGMTIPSSSKALGQEKPLTAKAHQKQIETLAVINGQPVTRNQIANECMRRFGKDVLKSMVNKLLVMQQCRKNGVMITEKDVNDNIVKKAKGFGMSAERYIATICGKRNMSVDRLKNDIIWHELATRRLAAQNIKVSPEELNARMESEFGQRVQVRQIVVDSMQQAQQIRTQAQADPESFERLAKSFSLDTNSKSIGGLLPPIKRNLQSPEYENIAFSLEPGQISQAFPIADKFIILRCERIFAADQLTPEQTVLAHERLISEISSNKLIESARQLFVKMQETTQVTNVMNDPKLSQQYPGVAALVGNVKVLKNQVGEECITRFGSEILNSEINRTLLMQALKKQGLQVTQQDLNDEIARAAKTTGQLKNDGSVNIEQWLAYVTNNDPSKEEFYIEDEVWPTVALKKLVSSTVSVTQEDMNKGFEANYGRRVEVKAILVSDHRSALKVWNMASANPTAEYFGELAHQYSIEPASKANYGAVPPIQMHGGRPELEKEAFKLQIGELSKVVQVGEHWIILYCLGQTEPVVTDFDAVKEELYAMILEKKMRLAMGLKFQNLRRDSQIDNFLAGTSQPGRAEIKTARRLEGTNTRAPLGQRR